MKIYKNLWYMIAAGLLLFMYACEEDEIRTNDIEPGLVRSEIDPLTQTSVEAGTQYTITGSNLDLVTEVTLAGTTVTIASKSESSLTFNVPAIFSIGPVSVTNKYKQVSTTEETVAPIYDNIAISSWPTTFEVGRPIAVEGTNVHLINKVTLTITNVNTDFHPASLIGTSFEINVNGSSGSSTSISIPTRELGIPYGATLVATAEGYSDITANATSPEITVMKPSDTFVPVDPVILWDFEDGVNPYVDEGKGATASIDGGGAGITDALGDHYLHVEASNADASWFTYGKLTSEEIDLGSKNFNEPYISFMINTGDAEGYFHMWIIQGGQTYEAHFNNDPDNYLFSTDGWEWRSYTLTPTDNNAGEWKTAGFDPMQPFVMELWVRTGNVGGGDFEINMDHIMITDGPVAPKAVESFETSVPDFGTQNGGAMEAVHLDNYFHYSYSVTADWAYQGSARIEGPLDLGSMERPFLNFWINTGGGTAYFQIETFQNGSKFGHDPNGYELYDTDGTWQLISIPLSDVIWSTWEGAGTFDAGAVSDYFSINLTPGNQASGTYELNIDGIILSDGPMFYYPNEE